MKQQQAGEHPAGHPFGTTHYGVRAKHNPRRAAARWLRRQPDNHRQPPAPTETSPHTPGRAAVTPGPPRNLLHLSLAAPTAGGSPVPATAMALLHAASRGFTCLHAETNGHASLQKAHSTRQAEQSAGMRKPGRADTSIRPCVHWDQNHGNPKMAIMDRLRPPTNLF